MAGGQKGAWCRERGAGEGRISNAEFRMGGRKLGAGSGEEERMKDEG